MNADNSSGYFWAATLGACFVALAASNLWTLVRYLPYGTRRSMIPLPGGITGCLAIEFCPYRLSRWWWMPLVVELFVVDPGRQLIASGGFVPLAWTKIRRRC